MIAIIQRVSEASVSIPNQAVSIGPGLLVLLGIHKDDTQLQVQKLAKKLLSLRILADKDQKMNLSIIEAGQQLLIISQFTLLADVKGGNRPSFVKAAPPADAQKLYQQFVKLCENSVSTKSGFFGQYMSVKLVNDGPTTIILDTKEF